MQNVFDQTSFMTLEPLEKHTTAEIALTAGDILSATRDAKTSEYKEY